MKLASSLFAAVMLLSPTLSSATTAYDITFKLNNSLSYDSIDISIDYSIADGDFSGSGATVSCTPNGSLNAIMAFNEASQVVWSGVMSTTPIAGPVVLFTCIFDSNGGAPVAGDFFIYLRGWSSSSTSTAPAIQISSIQVH